MPYSSLDVNFVMDVMNRARSRMNLVILDACRNNPFSRSFRSAATGLAQMDAPGGTLLAYATAPGKVASDGTGDNGLYTQYLLKHLPTPGLPVEIVFKRVREDVEKETKSQQVPWESSSVKGDFFFVPPRLIAQVALAAPAPVVPALDTVAQAEFAFWDSIKSSNSAADYQAYLTSYPTGRFATLAKARVAALERQTSTQGDSRDQSFWDSIRSSNNPAEYEAYLAQYPKGQYAAIARTRIEQFRRQAAAAAAPPPAPTPAPASAPVAAAPAFSTESLELAFWNSIQGTRIVDDYRAYLRQYPNGRFAELAKLRVEQLSAPPIASAAPAVVAPPRPAAPPPTQVASAAPTASSFKVPAGLKVKNPALLPQPGDSWTYKYTDPLNRPAEGNMVYEVKNVTDEGVEETFRPANQRAGQSTLTVEPGLRWAKHSGQTFVSPDFSPYVQAFGDLEEGKTVRIQVPSSRWGGDGQPYPLDVTMKGEEDITVPAGKFRARHIEIRGAAQAFGLAYGGNAAQSGAVLRVIVDIWYAPSIKRYVKYVGNATYSNARLESSSFELISYKVAGSDSLAALNAAPAPAPAAPVAQVQVASAAPTTAIARSGSPLAIGDTWIYQYVDGWKSDTKLRIAHSVDLVNDKEIVESLAPAGPGARTGASELSSSSQLEVREWSMGTATIRELTPFGLALDVLAPGQSIRNIPVKLSQAGGANGQWQASLQVMNTEEISVPAGKFKALKIVVTGERPVPRLVNGLPFKFTMTVWYAPELKRAAKISYFSDAYQGWGSVSPGFERDTYELVSFTPKN